MEKTFFTKDEIREFLYKLSRETHGESLLLPSMKSLLEPEVLVKAMSSATAYADFVGELSRKQGMVEGKVAIILRFMEFFHLNDKED
jgi:hypothetical protein